MNSRKSNTRNIAIGGAFAVLGAALVILAVPLEPPRHIPYGPGLFPTIVGVGMIVFGLIACLRAATGADPAPTPSPGPESPDDGPRFGLPVIAVLAAPIVFVVAAPPVGYLIVMPLLLGGLIRVMRGRWFSSLLIGTAVALVLQVLFQQAMRVPLPWGILEPLSGVLTWM